MEPISWINKTSVNIIIRHLSNTTSTNWKRFVPSNIPHNEPPYPDFSQIAAVRIVFICLFILEFVICVLGNTLVCITVFRSKAMHSPVNYYIVNLGICDFLVGVFVLPTKVYELTADTSMSLWDDVWCTVARYLETVIVFVSMLTVVASCVERYYAVVHPIHRQMHVSSARIGWVLSAVWILPCILASPNVYPALAASHHLYSKYGEFTRTTCFDRFTDNFRRTYYIALFISMYLVPLLLLGATGYRIFQVLTTPCLAQARVDSRVVSIEKARRKVAKMVLVVVLAFIICWSPYFIITIVTQFQAENFFTEGQYFFTMLCINFLGFANSCVNPMVYFVMSVRFREGYMNIVRALFCIGRPSHDPPWRGSLSSLRRESRPATEMMDRLVVLQNLPDIRLPLTAHSHRQYDGHSYF